MTELKPTELKPKNRSLQANLLPVGQAMSHFFKVTFSGVECNVANTRKLQNINYGINFFVARHNFIITVVLWMYQSYKQSNNFVKTFRVLKSSKF